MRQVYHQITGKTLNTIEIKNQPSREMADGHIASAMSCNGLLQRPAIMQAAHTVPEGPGVDEPPFARREVSGDGQREGADRWDKKDCKFIDKAVK